LLAIVSSLQLQDCWMQFTPWTALAGGVLIGLSAAWLLLFDGRILGASGILGGLAHPRRGDWQWRMALLIGLVASAPLAALLFKTEAPEIGVSWPILILAGLLVGVGARLAKAAPAAMASAAWPGFRPTRRRRPSPLWPRDS
jgi:uncharacterized membrane protein YedE/YeeE